MASLPTIHPFIRAKLAIVIRYVERAHTTCSFGVTSIGTHKLNGISQSGFDSCLDPQLAEAISHTALTERIGISDSRAIVR